MAAYYYADSDKVTTATLPGWTNISGTFGKFVLSSINNIGFNPGANGSVAVNTRMTVIKNVRMYDVVRMDYAQGAVQTMDIILRSSTDGSKGYEFSINPASSVFAVYQLLSTTTNFQIGSNTALGFTPASGDYVNRCVEVVTDSAGTHCRCSVWPLNGTEPTTWAFDQLDPNIPYNTAGYIAYSTVRVTSTNPIPNNTGLRKVLVTDSGSPFIAPAFTLNTYTASTSTTAITITATPNSGTFWGVGTLLSLSGGTGASIASQSINLSTQVVTLQLICGTVASVLTLANSVDNATASLVVSLATPTPSSNLISYSSGVNNVPPNTTPTVAIYNSMGVLMSSIVPNVVQLSTSDTWTANFQAVSGSYYCLWTAGYHTVTDYVNNIVNTTTSVTPTTTVVNISDVKHNDFIVNPHGISSIGRR